MFDKIKSWFKNKEPVWVGTAMAVWVDENKSEYATYIALYECANGTRSYKVVGDYKHIVEMHKQYVKVIVPWMGNCASHAVFDYLFDHNEEYWSSIEVHPKPTRCVTHKNDSNVINFPGKGNDVA